MSREIIYIGDPMCSWCWGFSPVLSAIHAEFSELAPMRIIVGGLRAGETKPMTGDMKAFIRHHWESVHEATGQPFCFDILEGDGFAMDTEPACRAVVTMRNLRSIAALPYFERLHHAFYAENKAINDAATLAGLAEPFGIAPDEFTEMFNDHDTKNRTAQDFVTSQRLGVRGFPTILLRNGADTGVLTAGYQSFENLHPLLHRWCHS